MNERLETLAAEKRYLVERSALCRLRLRRDVFAVRGAVGWKRMPAALATTPAVRTMVGSLALSLLGTGRAGRVLLFASRALLVAKLARATFGYAHDRAQLA